MTGEEVLTCAINIGEQLLDERSGDQPWRIRSGGSAMPMGFLQSHIFSIASCIIVTLETKDREWITQTLEILSYGTDMWKLTG